MVISPDFSTVASPLGKSGTRTLFESAALTSSCDPTGDSAFAT